jgi:hypothetical protein
MKAFFKIILVLALAPAVFCQSPGKTTPDQPPKKDAAGPDSYYKLNFGIFEVEDAKRVNQREYSMIVKSNDFRPTSVKASTRVPMATRDTKSQDTQIQYIDVGLEIRCSMLKELASKIAVTCDVSISNFVPEQSAEARNSVGPVLRATNANYAWAVLPPGKPTIFSTIDDVNSKKRIQIEVTATKVE